MECYNKREIKNVRARTGNSPCIVLCERRGSPLGDFKIFEAVMLLCFGISWPISIYKSYTSRKVGSKSVVFLYAILVGYIAGIINKLLYSPDVVLALYIINLIMVAADTVLYYRNVRIEKAEARKASA